MALVVIVTRDVAYKYRGFLSSIMLEIAPTVYLSPHLNAGIRARAWDILADWYKAEPQGSIVMVWKDVNEIGGVGIKNLGNPPSELVELDGLWVVKHMM